MSASRIELMSSGAKVRAMAAKTIAAVISGQAMDEPLAKYREGLSDKDKSFLSALVYGCMRRFPRHQLAVKHLLRNPNKPLNPMMQALLALGLEQIVATRVPPHAAVAATVAAAKMVNQHRGAGFLNAILRNFLREQEQIETQLMRKPQFALEHPTWMIQKLQKDWRDEWQSIIDANNHQAPMWLRVNRQKTDRDAYLALLQEAQINATPASQNDVGIKLDEPVAVEALPRFAEGWVSVQDINAQFAAALVDPQPGQRILDACAAPGGKAMHILETCDDVALTALDLSATRLERVAENAARLGVSLNIKEGNAALPEDWWDEQPYDTVLLDAPCSASGVIRRHPDIKLLRRTQDAAKFARIQSLLITALWPTLKPGGRLIYATCSVFPEENEPLIGAVVSTLTDAQVVAPNAGSYDAKCLNFGVQMFPNKTGGDGFYYAALAKTPFQEK